MARAAGGGVGYWLELPIPELLKFMLELADQLEDEREAMKEQASGRR
jgi:hypothetical protein